MGTGVQRNIILRGRERAFKGGGGSDYYTVTVVPIGHPLEEVHAELTQAAREAG